MSATKKTKIIVPTSGGKDSQACLLLALFEYPKEDVIPVFNDTGWEHPLTYAHLDYLEETLGITIHRTQGWNGVKDLEELIIRMGRFPFGAGRFCTDRLKQKSFRDFYREKLYDGETHHQVWMGIRTQESGSRKRKYGDLDTFELHDYGDIYHGLMKKSLRATMKLRFPILDWDIQEVFDFNSMVGEIKVNPLYDEHPDTRVGCYPCLLSGKKNQMRDFATPFGQQQLQKIRVLEEKIGQKYEMFDTDQGSCEACKI